MVSLINLHPRAIVEGEADTAPAARGLCARLKPDLVVIDVDISQGAGFDLIGELRRLHESHWTIVVSWQEEVQWIRRAFAAGANAYVSKFDELAEIRRAIESVIEGQVHVSSKISQRLIEEMIVPAQGRIGNQLSRLSNRELHVFRLLGKEKGASEIARELGVSIKTVETHQQRIKGKLQLKTAYDLHRTAEKWCKKSWGTRFRV